MEFADKELLCCDCGKNFIFSAGEQVFFKEKNFINDPKRCKLCKAKRAAEKSRVLPESQVQCEGCGELTTVPFKPSQGRPVYCRSCFQMQPKVPVPPKPVQSKPVATNLVATNLVATNPVATNLVATNPVATNLVQSSPTSYRPVSRKPDALDGERDHSFSMQAGSDRDHAREGCNSDSGTGPDMGTSAQNMQMEAAEA